MIEAQHFLLHVMKVHLNPSSAIQWSSKRDVDSRNDVSSRPLIAMSLSDQTAAPKSVYLNVVLHDGKRWPWNFEKFNFFRQSFHVPFDSLCY